MLKSKPTSGESFLARMDRDVSFRYAVGTVRRSSASKAATSHSICKGSKRVGGLVAAPRPRRLGGSEEGLGDIAETRGVAVGMAHYVQRIAGLYAPRCTRARHHTRHALRGWNPRRPGAKAISAPIQEKAGGTSRYRPPSPASSLTIGGGQWPF